MNAQAKKVLYVEDEQFFADTLKKLLTEAGYEVFLAKDGEEGLAIAKVEMPDVILLDIILPKIDGKEVLKQLKADPEMKKIPVIVLSNLNSEADVQATSNLGALHFFVKALTMPTQIVTSVKEVIGLPMR
jgi:CheY-like chemotaxis protein